MEIDRRQFIISKNAINLKRWSNININKLVLSYSDDLRVNEVYDKNGLKWILLGWAIQIEKNKKDPVEELKERKEEDITDIYESWTGRWILIGEDSIHLDASGSLGCFYTINSKEIFIGSSPSLISRILKEQELEVEEVTCKLERGSGMDYYPAPITRYSNIKRVFASQILIFEENRISFKARRLTCVKKYEGLSYKEQLDLLRDYFSQAVINLNKMTTKEIYVPLTAGMDSRLILSACTSNNINVKTITFEQDNMMKADKQIPKKISKQLGIEHIYVKKCYDNYNKELEEEFDLHCGKHCVDADRDLYSYGQFNIASDTIILLRGGVFETARLSYYYKKLTENQRETPEETIITAYDLENSSIQKEAIKEWCKWINENPEENVDWKHRYYLEVRVGSWLSYLEYADDITNTERIHLANSFNIISLMLSMPMDIRKNGQHQLDLINIFEPDLLKYKINQKTLLEKLRNKFKNNINKILK